jgi:hypothetical protein
MKAVADEFASISKEAATGTPAGPNTTPNDVEFFQCVRDVTDGKTNWFATTPAGLRLDANCRLGKPGRYNCRYLNMMSSADDDETRRTVAQALVVAHYKCFKYLYEQRKANGVATPASVNAFMREAKSRAVMFDETSGRIDIVGRFSNVTATNDLHVLVREIRADWESDDDDDDESWTKIGHITRLEEGAMVRFSGKLNAYDKGGSMYGVSLYLAKEILYDAPTAVDSSEH